jgi:hypothetical protein
LGKRNSYPAVEYNLDRQVVRNNREPLHPEQFFRLFNFVENTGINVPHNNLRILPAFSTVQDTDHQLEAMKYVNLLQFLKYLLNHLDRSALMIKLMIS